MAIQINIENAENLEKSMFSAEFLASLRGLQEISKPPVIRGTVQCQIHNSAYPYMTACFIAVHIVWPNHVLT